MKFDGVERVFFKANGRFYAFYKGNSLWVRPNWANVFAHPSFNTINLRADTKIFVFNGCRGKPVCSPSLKLMTLTTLAWETK